MKKSLSFIAILSFAISFCYGQGNKFERKLNKVRFSLNKVLEQYNDEKIIRMDYTENDSIILKINTFISENEKEIKKYRQYILKKYTSNSDVLFDIKKYNKVNLGKLKELKAFNIKNKIPLYRLLSINPFQEIEVYKDIFFTQKKSTQELAIQNVKYFITKSLIQTKKINKNRWQIIENTYDFIWKYTYDLEKGRITDFEVFERK
ncbi:MAG: hypothetical protein CSA38_01650 [Flavobacteriales bacterium]|nr:MAG: hypothetical protein CSA38_01650 [Flavobacteriales bacterium]